MSTKEQVLNVDEAESPVSLSQCFDKSVEPAKFIFDVALSTAIAANGKHEVEAAVPKGPLTPEMLDKMNRYWRAANYLCIGQIYLFENPVVTRATQSGTDQTKTARALGNFSRAKSHLHPSKPAHQRARRKYHLHRGSRTRRSIAQCKLVSRRHVYRSPPGDHAG